MNSFLVLREFGRRQIERYSCETIDILLLPEKSDETRRKFVPFVNFHIIIIIIIAIVMWWVVGRASEVSYDLIWF